MPLPKEPFPGMVVRYGFLWRREHDQGAREGRKFRPCVVVIATRRDPDGRFLVRVMPFTHAAPSAPDRAVAVPSKLKRHLGLDEDSSWVVIDEANEFVWPGPDLRPVAQTKPGVWTFGVLPRDFMRRIKDAVADYKRRRNLPPALAREE